MNYLQVAKALGRIGFAPLEEERGFRQAYSAVEVKNGLSTFKPFSRQVLFKGPPASEEKASVLKARVKEQLKGVDTGGVVLEVKKWAFGEYPEFRDHWVVHISPIRPRR